MLHTQTVESVYSVRTTLECVLTLIREILHHKCMTNTNSILNAAISGNALYIGLIARKLGTSHARAANLANATYTIFQREGRAAARANLERMLAGG